MDSMKAEIEGENKYLDIFKSKEKHRKDSVRASLAKYKIFVYDQAKKDELAVTSYCQKSKKETMWDKHMHPREEPKKANCKPLTTS